MTPLTHISIATRGSALALWQAEHMQAALARRSCRACDVSFEVIKTQGDKILDVPLAKVGGKGLFVKEIEQALLDRTSARRGAPMKDVPAELAPGLVLSAISTREVPWDALCTRAGGPRSLTRCPRARGSARRASPAVPAARAPPRSEDRDAARQRADARAQARRRRVRRDHPRRRRADAARPRRADHAAVAARGQHPRGRAGRARPRDARRSAGGRRAGARARCTIRFEERRVLAERTFLARMGGSCQTPLAAHAIGRDTLRVVGMWLACRTARGF